jgi:hypothetical protein
MIDLGAMEVGDTLPLSTKVDWEDLENRGAYIAAQEHTRLTGQLFSVDAVYKDTSSGRKISGYTITRTK